MSEPVEFIKVLADLIQEEMDLPVDKVFLYNQDADLGKYSGLYVNLGILGDKPFGASSEIRNDPELGLVENQSVNVQEWYSLLLSSQDNTARLRRHEPPMILRGSRCQQLMEKYSFKVGYLPAAMTDVSEVEATYRLNRYSLTFNCLVAYARLRAVEYYDKFTGSPGLIVNP